MRSFETFTILVYIIDEKIFDVDASDSDTWHKSPTWKQLVWSLLPQSRSAMLRRVGTYVRLTYNSETPKGDNFYQPNQKQKHFPFNFYLNQENTSRFHFLFFCCYLFIFFVFLIVVSTISSEVESCRVCPLRKFAQHVVSEVALCLYYE